MKRLFDFSAALVALIAFSPFLVLLWMAIVISEGRPGLFKQLRVGLNGRAFYMYKLRSMTHRPETQSGSFEAGNSARVTRIGKSLRKWKLDELPQFWNVLMGDMSIVGPRPEIQKWVDIYPERWNKILSIRPGITDPASIVFRDEEIILSNANDPETMYEKTVLPRKLDIYEDYLARQSFCYDIRIICRTISAIFYKNDRKKIEQM